MLPDRTRAYLITSLAATPRLLTYLSKTLPPSDPSWDESTGDRFTPREAIAHMADFEPIFRRRLEQTMAEEEPTLFNVDEEALAIEHRYSETDPAAEVRRFAAERAKTLELVASWPEDCWSRVGVHTKIGPMTAEVQLVQTLVHDGYHLEDLARRLGEGA